MSSNGTLNPFVLEDVISTRRANYYGAASANRLKTLYYSTPNIAVTLKMENKVPSDLSIQITESRIRQTKLQFRDASGRLYGLATSEYGCVKTTDLI